MIKIQRLDGTFYTPTVGKSFILKPGEIIITLPRQVKSYQEIRKLQYKKCSQCGQDGVYEYT